MATTATVAVDKLCQRKPLLTVLAVLLLTVMLWNAVLAAKLDGHRDSHPQIAKAHQALTAGAVTFGLLALLPAAALGYCFYNSRAKK